jgi:hypothetical protein
VHLFNQLFPHDKELLMQWKIDDELTINDENAKQRIDKLLFKWSQIREIVVNEELNKYFLKNKDINPKLIEYLENIIGVEIDSYANERTKIVVYGGKMSQEDFVQCMMSYDINFTKESALFYLSYIFYYYIIIYIHFIVKNNHT